MIPRHALISESYLEMQRILHAAPRGYGGRGDKWAETVIAVAKVYDAQTVLDYACGQGSLKRALDEKAPHLHVRDYDPAIAGKDGPPGFADLVNCTDCLEHIEPDKLDTVLAHLRSLARKALFVVISLKLTAKILADGRNAHIIVRPANWWKKRLEAAGFTIHRAPDVARKKKSHEYVVVLTP